jgi:capsular polysaccharide transport system permease protein
MTTPTAPRPGRRRFKTFRAVSALTLREMESTYGQSPGGYLWTIVEPAAGIALLSVVFSLVLRSPVLGTNFAYFFATGILPFMLYTGVSAKMAQSIQYSRPLLAYPALTFTDALLARFLLNSMTQLLVMLLVIVGIILVYNLRPIIDWPSLFLGLAMLLALTASVGVMNCYLTSRFPIWGQIWAVLNRPMFILSGILFIPENVPARFRDWFMLNPVAHITSQIRKGFFITYDAVYVQPVYVFVISCVLGIFGMLFLLKNYQFILQR